MKSHLEEFHQEIRVVAVHGSRLTDGRYVWRDETGENCGLWRSYEGKFHFSATTISVGLDSAVVPNYRNGFSCLVGEEDHQRYWTSGSRELNSWRGCHVCQQSSRVN